MKKNFVLMALIGLVMTTLCGCGGKVIGSNAIKGENGKEYESYREACRDGDFDAAHKFLDRMKEKKAKDWEDVKKMEEAEDYVFNYEVNTLVSQNSEEANTRIIYLLNEIPIEGTKQPIGKHFYNGSDYGNCCNRFNIKLNKILELAISTGNQDIAKKILPLYKEDENRDEYNDITGYSYETKDAAQAKYDEAFGEEKEGVVEEKVQSAPKESKKKRRK